VIRGGAAAAADDPHAGLDEPLRVDRHVLGTAEVEVPVVDGPRLPRVRLRHDGQLDRRGEVLDRLEHRRGAHRAVDADGVDA